MSDILLRAQVRVQTTLYHLRHRQEGQGLVEYGLIIASIAILLIIAMLFLAGKIDDLFSRPAPASTRRVRCRSRIARPHRLRSRPKFASVPRPGYPSTGLGHGRAARAERPGEPVQATVAGSS